MCLLQFNDQGQRHLDRPVQAPSALLVLQALQEALRRPRQASSGGTPRELWRISSGETGEKRRQAGSLCRSISSVRNRNRSPYFKSLLLICLWSTAWGLNIEVFAGISLQRAPASIIFQYFQQTSVVRILQRLPAGTLSSSVGTGLVHCSSVGVPSSKKSVRFCIPFITLVPWGVPMSD